MTDFQRFFLAFLAIAGIFLSAGFAWKIGKARGYSEGYSAPHPSDTTFVVDTHYVDRPVEVVKYVDRERPVYIAVHDTTRINDTTFVVLPREVKTYADSTYRAQVSGVQPSLDWIEVYQKTTTITQYVEKPTHYKWTLSAFAEASATLYRFDVRAGLEYERQIAGPLRGAISAGYEYSNIGRGVFVEGGVKLQILKK